MASRPIIYHNLNMISLQHQNYSVQTRRRYFSTIATATTTCIFGNRLPTKQFADLCSSVSGTGSFNGFLADDGGGRRRRRINMPYHQQLGAILNGHASFSTSTGGDATDDSKQIGNKNQTVSKIFSEEQVADMKILCTLVKYLWLKDNLEFHLRVVTALGFLVGAKVLNVQVPSLFKLAVDWLTTATDNASSLASFTSANSSALAFFVTPTAVLVGYGIALLLSMNCELLCFPK